jgi:hypothetical protein
VAIEAFPLSIDPDIPASEEGYVHTYWDETAFDSDVFSALPRRSELPAFE